MNDHLVPDLVSAMVDGEVSPEERRDAHAHLQICPDCRATMDEYTVVQRMVSGLPRLSAPQDLVASLLEPARGPRALAKRAFRGPRKYVAAGLAAAAVSISVAGVMAPADESRPPVDVLVARHAGVSAGNSVPGQVIVSVTGR